MYWRSTNIKEQKNTNTPRGSEQSNNRIWTSYTAGVTGKAQSHTYMCVQHKMMISLVVAVSTNRHEEDKIQQMEERGKKCESFLSRARLLLHVFFLHISVCNFRFRCGLTAILFPFISFFIIYIFIYHVKTRSTHRVCYYSCKCVLVTWPLFTFYF